MPAEQTDETLVDEEETLSEFAVQDTKAEIEAAEQMRAEQTEKISVDCGSRHRTCARNYD